jgi:hypothetical protein
MQSISINAKATIKSKYLRNTACSTYAATPALTMPSAGNATRRLAIKNTSINADVVYQRKAN